MGDFPRVSHGLGCGAAHRLERGPVDSRVGAFPEVFSVTDPLQKCPLEMS